MNLSYKDTDFFRNFNDIMEEHSQSRKIKKQKEALIINNDVVYDQQIIDRVFKNFNLLSSSNENYHILVSLKNDISQCPISVKQYIQRNSISKCFQNAFELQENPKLLIEIIDKIIKIDITYAEFFSQDILDILHLLRFQECLKVATKLAIDIIENSTDGADKLIYDGLFDEMSQALESNETFLFESFIHVIKACAKNCANNSLFQNKYTVLPLLQTLFFACPNLHHEISYCFRMLLDKTDCKPSVLLTHSIFEIIQNEFASNSSVIEYLYLFNAILYYNNDEANHEDKDTFFLKYENIFDQFIDKLQNSIQQRMIFRLLANFSYVNNYCQLFIFKKIYEQVFEIVLSGDIPFNCKEDSSIFFCRLYLFSPNEIISYPHFTELFNIMTDTIESIHSDYLTECFINVIDNLYEFLKKTQNQLNIDLIEIYTHFADSDTTEIAQWAASRLSSIYSEES